MIELLVVLLILGILLAIAIPNFLSVTKSAANTAATANLQTALTASDTFYTQNSASFTGLNSSSTTTASNLSSQGTGLTFFSGSSAPSTKAQQVSVFVNAAGNAIVLAAATSTSGRCYVIVDQKVAQTTANDGASTAAGTYYGWVAATSTNCYASATTPAVTNFQTTGFPS